MRLQEELLRELAHPRAATRLAAVRKLIIKPDSQAFSALTALVHDVSPRVQLAAIQALGRLGGSAVAVLTEILGECEPPMRIRVMSALGHTGHAQAATSLLNLMVEPDLPREVLEALARAVTRIGDAAGGPLSDLLTHPNLVARANATELLIRIAGRNPGPGLRAALPALRRRLGTPSENLEVRWRMHLATVAIEAVTASTRSIPVAAGPACPIPTALPAPARERRA